MLNIIKYKKNAIIKALLISKDFNILSLSVLPARPFNKLLTKPFNSNLNNNNNFNNLLKLILNY